MSTGLLVSVRDISEAADALSAGADLIDLKEPKRGPLGAVDVTVMSQVVSFVAGRVPVSVALGELLDYVPLPGFPTGIRWAKFGLAGCGSVTSWCDRLQAAVNTLPAGTEGVAVIYADWESAAAPAPQTIVQQALRVGCRAVLVDTWDKSHSRLLSAWSIAECRTLLRQLDELGLQGVLAGSLRPCDIELLLPLEPDFIAVRGAACEGDRSGRIAPSLVRELAALVHGSAGVKQAIPRENIRHQF